MDLLETTVTRYTGEARLQRLVYMASHAPEADVQRAAHEAAVQQARASSNLHRVRALGAADAAWYKDTEAQLRQARNVLTGRLQAAQAHLNKEAIRTAYLALAHHDCAAGDLQEALHAVLRAKDYCTSRQQTAQVSLQILHLALHLKQYVMVRDYVNKIEHTLGQTPAAGGGDSSEAFKQVRMQVWTAAALERLATGDYAAAARKFRAVACAGDTSTFSNNAPEEATEPAPTELLTPDDIALYAAVLSLAKVESRESLVALAEDPEALELVPQLQQALDQFGRRANYRAMWEILEQHALKPLTVDVYMGPHLQRLAVLVRETALQYYWKPFRRVPCSVMAEQLGPGLVPSVEQLVATLAGLIGRGVLPNTRLDLYTQTLVRTMVSDDEALLVETQQKLSRLVKSVTEETYAMALRLACLEFDLSVADPTRRGGTGLAGRRSGIGAGSGHYVDYGLDEDDFDDHMDTSSSPPHHHPLDHSDMNPEDLY